MILCSGLTLRLLQAAHSQREGLLSPVSTEPRAIRLVTGAEPGAPTPAALAWSSHEEPGSTHMGHPSPGWTVNRVSRAQSTLS